jgi:hypothetical protein
MIRRKGSNLMTSMKKNIRPILVALVATAAFLYWALVPPSYFNFLPFAIHENFFSRVTTNGEIVSTIDETTFIRAFDIVFGILIFWIIFRISRSIFRNAL